ncbi:MAG: FAD:protein FMN transferase [Spirochaetia bacterium]|jgi:thiamine biosynthesis lipoprotein|nr:FAD:protein FMN transferase [Spirochaetia bacterium]
MTMKMVYRFIHSTLLIFFALLFLFLGSLTGCRGRGISAGGKKEPFTESRFQLGTLIDLTVYDRESSSVFRKAFDLISEYENMLSRNVETSEISVINKNAGKMPAAVSENTLYAIKKGLEYSALTGGLFDVSIGPLVSLWGIGTESARVPSAGEIRKAVELTDYKKIILSADKHISELPAGMAKNSVFLAKEGMQIDLGAVAKGFIADKVFELFEANGVRSAIINLGGNVLLLGSKPEGIPFKIGIQNPFDTRGSYLGIIEGINISIVTSGIYERYLEKEGKIYHHILNPKTGYPVENDIMGISVITEKSIDGDCLSTSLFMLGSVKALDLVEKLEKTEAVIITREIEILLIIGAKKILSLNENNFIVI